MYFNVQKKQKSSNSIPASMAENYSPIKIKMFESPKNPSVNLTEEKKFQCHLTPIEQTRFNSTPTPSSAFKAFHNTNSNASPITFFPSTNTNLNEEDNGITFGEAMNTVMNFYFDK